MSTYATAFPTAECPLFRTSAVPTGVDRRPDMYRWTSDGRGRTPRGRFAAIWRSATGSSVADYKDAREKDFSTWIFAAALLMTVGFVAMTNLASKADVPHTPFQCATLWLALAAYAATGFLALKCINDFFIYYLLSINTPPAYYDMLNTSLLYKDGGDDDDARGTRGIRGDMQWWASRVLRTLGVKNHHFAFYQSMQMLCAGVLLTCMYYRYNQLFLVGATLLFGCMAIFVLDIVGTTERMFNAQDELYSRIVGAQGDLTRQASD